MSKFFFGLWLLLAGCSHGPQRPRQAFMFHQANAEQRQGHYRAAVGQYQQLEQQGVSHPALFCNLGSAFCQAGRVGWARYYYEKALRLAPLDTELIANQQAAQALVKPPGPVPGHAASGRARLNAADRGMIVAACCFLLGGICYLAGTIRAGARGKQLVAACWYLLPASVLLFLAAGGLLLPLQQRAAIIVAPKTSIRSGPSYAASQVSEVSEGEKVEVQKSYRAWLKVRTTRGEQGWISARNAAQLPN